MCTLLNLPTSQRPFRKLFSTKRKSKQRRVSLSLSLSFYISNLPLPSYTTCFFPSQLFYTVFCFVSLSLGVVCFSLQNFESGSLACKNLLFFLCHLSPFVGFIIIFIWFHNHNDEEERERERGGHFLTQCGQLQLTLLQWEDLYGQQVQYSPLN